MAVGDDALAAGMSIMTGSELANTLDEEINLTRDYIAQKMPAVATPVGVTPFTGVTAVTLDAVFPAGFKVHRIILNIESSSAAAALNFRYRASAATLSGSGTYITQQNYNSSDSTYFSAKDTDDKADVMPAATTSPRSAEFLISNALSSSLPTLAQINGFTWVSSHHIKSEFGLRFTPTTAVDGFTLYPASGTITGSLKVEGVM